MNAPSSVERLLKLIEELLQRLDELIATIQGNIKYSFGTTVTILFAGVAATTFFYFSTNSKFKEIPDLMKLGPGLIGISVSAFPLKLFMESRERLIYYKHLKHWCENSEDMDENELSGLSKEVSDALKDIARRG